MRSAQQVQTWRMGDPQIQSDAYSWLAVIAVIAAVVGALMFLATSASRHASGAAGSSGLDGQALEYTQAP